MVKQANREFLTSAGARWCTTTRVGMLGTHPVINSMRGFSPILYLMLIAATCKVPLCAIVQSLCRQSSHAAAAATTAQQQSSAVLDTCINTQGLAMQLQWY
jgi:hypothetical protein